MPSSRLHGRGADANKIIIGWVTVIKEISISSIREYLHGRQDTYIEVFEDL